MKPLKTKVSITLDTDVIETIKDLAENDDRSFSQYINLVLKDFLAQMNCQKKGCLTDFIQSSRGGSSPYSPGRPLPVYTKNRAGYIFYILCSV